MRKELCSSPQKSVPTAVHLWLVWIKAAQAIGRVHADLLRQAGLGESEFRVMEALLHKGALPVNVIGPKVDLTCGSISVAVDRLYGRGLVTRNEDPADRRVRLVDLTAEGRRLIEPVFDRHAADLEEIMRVLSDEERTQLEHLLKKAGRHAEKVSGQDRGPTTLHTLPGQPGCARG